jgi:hypothetical protein
MLRSLIASSLLLASVGCHLAPDITHVPIVRNPFPQLSRVAIAPFINQSDEKTVDGLQFANAYFTELQSLQGFEVVPPTLVEAAMRQSGISLNGPDDARRLAQLLDVDVVVVGVVTEFTPYYPPRCGMKVSWYAANPNFHPIPAGYGLPWGTSDEEFIPESLVYEAEFALAREQLKTETPAYGQEPEELPSAPSVPALRRVPAESSDAGEGTVSFDDTSAPSRATASTPTIETIAQGEPYRGSVMSHTRIYRGDDRTLTEALANYFYLQNDARGGGWQSYLQRSDDFIRFSCHMHITEMLTARGGGGQTRVVWRWSENR